ncbi:AMP-binding protein [Sphingomonas oligophenolica]|uniref:Acyl-CoA synthetase n=1 Tax=Sphingomonas oligophenolica TaxID=301154 RepID=A0A502CJ14_9SPHN|nr:AMP-binding protein [Sphingomonas oligophenolica]TPG13625.1 acyl-CoA synthetase [Sphingomonas oligophenolica]
MNSTIRIAALRSLIWGVVISEIARLRGPGGLGVPKLAAADRDDATLDEAGLGIDSLEQMGVWSGLSEMFAIDVNSSKRDDTRAASVAQWAAFVIDHWQDREPALWLRSSGTTGTPKLCRHLLADLLDEAKHFSEVVGTRRRVLALVPGEHIYGLIWTILLPAVADLPVFRTTGVDGIPLAPGDLVIAAPDHWRGLVRAGAHIPADVIGVNAAGPLADADKRKLLDAGLARMLDVYGSSETGGIGIREGMCSDYTLLPRWQFAPPADGDGDGDERHALVSKEGTVIALPDTIVVNDAGFKLGVRRDGAIQVGGRNVDPALVANALLGHPMVGDVAIRLGDTGRLKAFVVPRGRLDGDQLIGELAARASASLPAYARPVAYRLGEKVPRNALGKLEDWT